MRRIGLIEQASDASRFCDYLTTLGIDASTEPAGGDGEVGQAHSVWIKEESQVAEAKAELAEFIRAPTDPRFAVGDRAAKLKADKVVENRNRLKNQQTVRHRALPGSALPGLAGGDQSRPVVVLITIVVCIAVGVVTNFGEPRPMMSRRGDVTVSTGQRVIEAMSFVSRADQAQSSDAFASIRKGEVWRLLTPAVLHGGILHLAMNMVWLFMLGGAIERLQGRGVIALLLFVTAIAGTIVQAIWPLDLGGGPNAVGASGATYGLLGYVWMRPFYDPEFALRVPPFGLILAVAFLLLGLTSVIGNVANGAHVGGLIAGMISARFVRVGQQGSMR